MRDIWKPGETASQGSLHTSAKLWRRAINFPLSVPVKINRCLISEDAEFLQVQKIIMKIAPAK
jgi:hypothetical protein